MKYIVTYHPPYSYESVDEVYKTYEEAWQKAQSLSDRGVSSTITHNDELLNYVNRKVQY
jgi:hypothetical protein